MTPDEFKTHWKNILVDLKPKIRDGDFAMYMRNTAILEKTDGFITIGFPNAIAKDNTAAKFHDVLLSSIKIEFNEIKDLNYEIDTTLASASDTRTTKTHIIDRVAASFSRKKADEGVEVVEGIKSREINEKYTFENFMTGTGNKLAFVAAQAVAAKPGKENNPLFIWGGVGLGKTHLLQACGNALKKRKNFKIAYVTAEQWFNDYVAAVRSKKNAKFHAAWRQLDCLIIDDIQTIATKEGTQNEFFHTFNTLYEAGKQIIIAADRHPRDLHGIVDRLTSRFSSGMVAQIEMPDFETRLAIAQNRLAKEGVMIPPNITEMLAHGASNSIRELEGALTQLIARVRTLDERVTIDTVASILGTGLPNHSENNFSSRSIQKIPARVDASTVLSSTAIHFNIPEKEIRGKSRKREFLTPRHVAMFVMRDVLQLSLEEIGKIFARDHTTVMHACEKVRHETMDNPQGKIARDVAILRTKMQTL